MVLLVGCPAQGKHLLGRAAHRLQGWVGDANGSKYQIHCCLIVRYLDLGRFVPRSSPIHWAFGAF